MLFKICKLGFTRNIGHSLCQQRCM
jgi:hypothetical protein